MSSTDVCPRILVIASGNAGKVREFRNLLAHLPLQLQSQPEGLQVDETGTTFAANARLKALAVARCSGQWALADDSGLSVTALGGAPGVHSARYAASDPERIARLLRELGDADDRSAQFCAALCVAAPRAIRICRAPQRGVHARAPQSRQVPGCAPNAIAS